MLRDKAFLMFADIITLNFFHNGVHVLHLAIEHLHLFSFFILHSLQFRGIASADGVPEHSQIHDYFFGPLSSSQPSVSPAVLRSILMYLSGFVYLTMLCFATLQYKYIAPFKS